MLTVTNLVVSFDGKRCVDGLNLSVPQGSVYALLGGNGAGKTTTLNALLGFVQPTSGQVRVGGFSPVEQSVQARALMAYLPENVALYPYLSGLENLRYFCALSGKDPGPAAAASLLQAAGLDGGAHSQRVSAYSKGMRQKVGLAIAQAKGARAMLLDEPTSGLDPAAANDFAQRLKLASQTGMAVLMATHDLFNAKQVANRIGILRQGRMVDEFDADSVSHTELQAKYLTHARGVEEIAHASVEELT